MQLIGAYGRDPQFETGIHRRWADQTWQTVNVCIACVENVVDASTIFVREEFRSGSPSVLYPAGLYLFGGLRSGVLSNDLLRATPNGWVTVPWPTYEEVGPLGSDPIRIPLDPPKPRRGAVFAFHPERHTLMFGGETVAADGRTPELLDDTWSGMKQTATVGTRPPARAYAASTYDARRREVIVFGGRGPVANNVSELRADMWAWNGSWKEITPSTNSPAQRAEHAMAYDAIDHKMVLFGGTSDSQPFFSDTWTWNGARWAEVPLGPGSGRAGHAMASLGDVEIPFLPFTSARVAMFGGYNGSGRSDDFLVWVGDRWVNMITRPNPAGPWRTCPDEEILSGTCSGNESYYHPTARSGHSMAFVSDRLHRHLLVFGGESDGFLIDPRPGLFDHFLYAWSESPSDWDGWRLAGPTSIRDPATQIGPAPRTQHAMTYDSWRDRLVLFGGQIENEETGRREDLGDLWEWDGAEWTQPVVQGRAPRARRSHAMVFDESRGRTMLYGGRLRDTPLDDVWEWDGQTWHEVTTPGMLGPGPRSSFAMAYDEGRNTTVVVGGRATQSSATWELTSGSQQVAAIQVSFDWSYAHIDPSSVMALRIQSLAGAQGPSSPEGTELTLWNAQQGHWAALGSNRANASTPERLTGHVASMVSSLLTDGRWLHLLVAQDDPRSVDDVTPELAVEGIEVVLEYVLD